MADVYVSGTFVGRITKWFLPEESPLKDIDIDSIDVIEFPAGGFVPGNYSCTFTCENVQTDFCHECGAPRYNVSCEECGA